jgi:hypothetical protein
MEMHHVGAAKEARALAELDQQDGHEHQSHKNKDPDFDFQTL